MEIVGGPARRLEQRSREKVDLTLRSALCRVQQATDARHENDGNGKSTRGSLGWRGYTEEEEEEDLCWAEFEV